MKTDSILTGILVTVVGIIVSALLIMAVFAVLGIPFVGNLHFFILSFVLPILLLRYYTKKLQFIRTSKAIMITLFAIMLPFIIILVRMGEIC